MVGLWADLDIAGPAHRWDESRGLRLPASAEEAMSIAEDITLPPTAVVDSGHGLQVWWLFATPLVFASDDDRAGGAALSAAFGSTLVELGRRRGLHVDDVSDLARILRPPGTVNRKAGLDPVPVRLVECHPERRYNVADVQDVLLAPDLTPLPTRPPQRPIRAPNDDCESPAEAFSRLVTWGTVLEPAGFGLMYDHGGAGYWHHPASTTGPRSVSATTDAHGAPVLVVHSESAAAATGLPGGPGHRLTGFRVWAVLNFGGDESAAARSLRNLGRGAA